MKVLGVDPGLVRTGYGCIAVDLSAPSESPGLVEAGVLRLRRETSVPARLVELERDLLDLIDRVRPSCVCVESLFAHYGHPRTAIVMGHARGVILLAAARAGLRVLELPPAEVKKSVTGNGRASKEQMQEAVAVLLGLASVPEPSDVADAIGIAVCGSRRLSDPLEMRVIEPVGAKAGGRAGGRVGGRSSRAGGGAS